AGGGAIAMAITYPFSNVSSRQQVQLKGEGQSQHFVELFQKILSDEGVKGLYSGLDSALLGITATNGVYYYFYELSKAAFESISRRKQLNTIESIASGTIAGIVTVLSTNPIWVVNTRTATKKQSIDEASETNSSSKHVSFIDSFQRIIREDGYGGLWQGVVPALILVINPIIQYTIFEQAKNLIGRSRQLGSLDFFFLGAISKLIATSITYPYIVIKSRMQLKQSNNEEARYYSTADGFRKILRNEGARGLYKGIDSKLLQSVLTAAILFVAKENLFNYTIKLLGLLGVGSAGRKGSYASY
ncbi:peroxisomal membrane protein PMP47B, partial [Conidiobolus coronatus NRRL 28638]